MTHKQEALKAISDLPDSADFEEIIYRLYVLEQIHKGQEDVKEGKLTNLEDLEKEAADW